MGKGDWMEWRKVIGWNGERRLDGMEKGGLGWNGCLRDSDFSCNFSSHVMYKTITNCCIKTNLS